MICQPGNLRAAAGKKYRRIDDEQLRDLIRQLAVPNVACFVVESQSVLVRFPV